jgi:hypothetical protein
MQLHIIVHCRVQTGPSLALSPRSFVTFLNMLLLSLRVVIDLQLIFKMQDHQFSALQTWYTIG